jgi:hypothetical protein
MKYFYVSFFGIMLVLLVVMGTITWFKADISSFIFGCPFHKPVIIKV